MIEINKNNLSFYICDDTIRKDWFINNYKNWENFSFKVIDDLVDYDKTFIDIGAWIGPILLYVANKSKCVIGIDCDHVAFDSLVKNVNCNDFKDNVKLEYAALYNKNKLIYVGGSKRKSEWGSSEIKFTDEKDLISKQISGVTIDYLVEKYNINDCGFVKMDIEGGEMRALLGAINVIKHYHPVLSISIYHSGKDFFEIKPWLASIYPGYKFFIKKIHPFVLDREVVLLAY